VHPGHPDCPEFLLPWKDIPARHSTALDPWLIKVASLGPVAVKAVLEERWKEVPPGPLQKLRSLILQGIPTSIVFTPFNQGWIVVDRPEKHSGKVEARPNLKRVPAGGAKDKVNTDPSGLILPFPDRAKKKRIERKQPRSESVFLIPPPFPRKELDESLSRYSFARRELIYNFFVHFEGLKDWFPRYNCEFTLPWYTMSQSYGEDRVNDPLWTNAMSIFGTICGDQLIIRPDGRLAWWLHEDGSIGQVFDDFEDFLVTWYLPYKENCDDPLEPFYHD
jgi:hypothetical protein